MEGIEPIPGWPPTTPREWPNATVYLSGPMRGIPQFNAPAFAAAAQEWRRLGWKVINPVEQDALEAYETPGIPLDDQPYIRRDVEVIMSLKPGRDKVAVLAGWAGSVGATAEVALARWRGVEVVWAQPYPLAYTNKGLKLGDVVGVPTPTQQPVNDINTPKTVGGGLGFVDSQVNRMREGVRTFSGGATRDLDNNKYDYEAFLSPKVLERFGEYMHKHRKQADGSLRAGDNWQKGMPQAVFVKSLFRHFMDVWKLHRSYPQPSAMLEQAPLRWTDGPMRPKMQEALCAVMFNAMGLLHEVLSGRSVPESSPVTFSTDQLGNQYVTKEVHPDVAKFWRGDDWRDPNGGF